MCDWVSVALRTCVACLRDFRTVLRVEVWLGVEVWKCGNVTGPLLCGSVEVWLGPSSAKQSNGGRGGRREEDKGRQRQKKEGEGGETWIAVNLAGMQQEGDQLTSLTDWVVDNRSAQASTFPPLAKGTSWSGGPDELLTLMNFVAPFVVITLFTRLKLEYGRFELQDHLQNHIYKNFFEGCPLHE